MSNTKWKVHKFRKELGYKWEIEGHDFEKEGISDMNRALVYEILKIFKFKNILFYMILRGLKYIKRWKIANIESIY